MLPLIAQLLRLLLRKGLLTYRKTEPGKKCLELSGCWKHCLAPLPRARTPADRPRWWRGGGARPDPPRSPHGRAAAWGAAGGAWAGTGRQEQAGWGPGRGWVSAVLPAGHHRDTAEGGRVPAAQRRCLWPRSTGSGVRGRRVAPGAPLPWLRAAREGVQVSSSLLPSLDSSFRFWAMSFIYC